ncbi:hypothetical protein [Streptomyces sp. NBC_00442]|uniref:hypothetical protein n=1 Tax=Streptomyces sp. NBC_00442 TaxID=2903651 RepID=UPI003FA68D52
MVRNVIGSILALVGAAAAVWSPFRAWYDGRHGSAYRIDDLFSGISADKAEVAGSMLLPFAFAALVTLIALVLRSRVLVIVAALVVLGFTVLWMVRQGQAAGSLTVDSSGKGLGQGVALALGGGVVMLIGAALMSGRRSAPARSRYGRPTLDERAARRDEPAYEAGREEPVEPRPSYEEPGRERPGAAGRPGPAGGPYQHPGDHYPGGEDGGGPYPGGQSPGQAPPAQEPPAAGTRYRHASDSPYTHGHPVGAPYEPRSAEPPDEPLPEEPPEEPPADEPRHK